MATLYDFPLDLLKDSAVAAVMQTSSTVGNIYAGYRLAISRCEPASAHDKNLQAMMNFFVDVGLYSKTILGPDLKYKNDTIAPKYQLKAGFNSFPLGTFITNVKDYLKGGAKANTQSPPPSSTGKQGPVAAAVPTSVVNTAVSAVKVMAKGVTINLENVSETYESFYFKYHEATDTVTRDLLLSQKFLVVHERARSRGIECTLTLQQLKAIFKRKTCFYTKKAFKSDCKLMENPSLDRIDPNKGYVEGNVVLCTYWANSFKNKILEVPSDSLNTDVDTLLTFAENLKKTGLFVSKSEVKPSI